MNGQLSIEFCIYYKKYKLLFPILTMFFNYKPHNNFIKQTCFQFLCIKGIKNIHVKKTPYNINSTYTNHSPASI